MNHEIGDKVKIRGDLIVGATYGNCEFVKEMSIFSGSSAVITEIITKDEQYRINVDNGLFYWHDSMFSDSWMDRIIGFASKKYKTYANIT